MILKETFTEETSQKVPIFWSWGIVEGKSSPHRLENDAKVEGIGLYYFDALPDFKSVNVALKVTQRN